MDYRLSLEHKPAYLHATVSGENTRQNVERHLGEIRRECIARGCRRVLVEERLVRLFARLAEAGQWLTRAAR
jgi:hypothetical protein